MRTLSATLQAAQEMKSRAPVKRVVLTSGATSYTYGNERILSLVHTERDDSHTAVIELQNSDHALDDIALKGFSAVISHGFKGTAGAEYSACAPLKVVGPVKQSAPGMLRYIVSLMGMPDLLKEDKAKDDYNHHATSVKTVKDLVTEILDGQPVAEELTVSQNVYDSWLALDDTKDAAGQRLTLDKTITKVSFRLKKTGSPTGNITFKIDDLEGNNLASKVLGDASTIAALGGWYEVTFDVAVAINEEVDMYCVHSGDASNYISVAYNSSAVKAGEYFIDFDDTGSVFNVYSDLACAYRYKYSYAGISVYEDCAAYEVVFDSEDSLIDTYCPADSFTIREDEDRLSVVDKLLFHTGCQRRPEADGKWHVFVPTISGTTYDAEYSLASGHSFFNKSTRDALVIPNKIIVRSLKGAAAEYTGSATSAASFALLPKIAYVRTTVESNVQAAAIAAAIMSRAEVNAQQGGASIPCNAGSELYDYVLVTDGRQGDAPTGNVGTITRTFKNYPGKPMSDSMYFSFGRTALKSVPGTRISALMKNLATMGIQNEDGSIPWGELYPLLDEMTANLRDLNVAMGWVEAETPAEQLIEEGLAGYLKALVNDKDPTLGAALDANGFMISNLGILRAVTSLWMQIGTTTKFNLTDTALDLSVPLDMNTNKITSLATPTEDGDAATKAYADGLAALFGAEYNVTASRAMGTDYRNTHGKPMMVIIILKSDSAGDYVSIRTEPSTGGTTSKSFVYLGDAANTYNTVIALVPNNWYYNVALNTGTATVTGWREYY